MRMLAAVDAPRAAGIAPTSNLKFFFEGEEEAGSPTWRRSSAHTRICCMPTRGSSRTGPVRPSGRKQVVIGVRGDVNVEVTAYGPSRRLDRGVGA
jgi:acetylornithine deacetylase/succinyl-diaminopimelate desuccinylase-like protein